GGLLDAPDLGLGVVALDLHPPHAEDAGPDPDPGTGAAHAGQGRVVHLLPHLAIVEAVALAAAEAGELADDAGHDRLVRTEVEEAPVLLHDLAAAFLAGLLRGSGDGGSGLLLHAAVEPGVQACQFLRGQLVQAGGAELLRRHRLLDRRRLLRRDGGGEGQQDCGQDAVEHAHGCSSGLVTDSVGGYGSRVSTWPRSPTSTSNACWPCRRRPRCVGRCASCWNRRRARGRTRVWTARPGSWPTRWRRWAG